MNDGASQLMRSSVVVLAINSVMVLRMEGGLSPSLSLSLSTHTHSLVAWVFPPQRSYVLLFRISDFQRPLKFQLIKYYWVIW